MVTLVTGVVDLKVTVGLLVGKPVEEVTEVVGVWLIVGNGNVWKDVSANIGIPK